MKKINIIFFIVVISIFGACVENAKNKVEVSTETKALQEKVANEIISWGAVDAYFDDDNYFIYCVNKSDISASANEVAAAMYPMVTEVPNVKGCIVKDAQTREELGRYEVK